MNIMQTIQIRLVQSTLRAFTLLESLLTLFVVSFIALMLSSSVHGVFQYVEEQIFFMEFEHLYKTSQKLAISSHQEIILDVNHSHISNGYQTIVLPETIEVKTAQQLVFNKKGGNSSLAKLAFSTETKDIRYQLYLGSGRYQRSEE